MTPLTLVSANAPVTSWLQSEAVYGASLGVDVMRSRKVVLIATAVVVVLACAALVLATPSRVLEVRLGRLLATEGKAPGALGDQRALTYTGKTAAAGETWMAEFHIQVLPKSRIWITDGEIGVETLGAGGEWTRTASSGSAPFGGRVICRTIWLALPAQVKKCRFTIGFRRQTLLEEGESLLDQSGCSRRCPAISGWIMKHLPNTERWKEYRCEVLVTESSMQSEAHNFSPEPTAARASVCGRNTRFAARGIRRCSVSGGCDSAPR